MTYTTVPILNVFNHDAVIGELKILTSALPITPNFVFSLGYKVNGKDGKYELICVSPVQNTEYLEYLNKNKEQE